MHFHGERWLKSLGLFSLEKTEGKLHCGLQYAHKGKWGGRYWSLHSCDSERTWENSMELSQSRFGLGNRKRFEKPEDGWALEWAPLVSGHSTKPDRVKEPLDSTVRHMVWLLRWHVQEQELDLMILVVPFQLNIFCCSSTKSGWCSIFIGRLARVFLSWLVLHALC